jgi:hypothetical protein
MALVTPEDAARAEPSCWRKRLPCRWQTFFAPHRSSIRAVDIHTSTLLGREGPPRREAAEGPPPARPAHSRAENFGQWGVDNGPGTLLFDCARLVFASGQGPDEG